MAKKKFLLAIDFDLYEEIKRMAEEEMRPVNSQIIFLIKKGLEAINLKNKLIEKAMESMEDKWASKENKNINKEEHEMNCKEKVRNFISNLIKLRYNVKQISKKPQLYRINNKIVNIRCHSKPRKSGDSYIFWYSINLNVLPRVDYVIYLMTSPEHFVMFPKNLILELSEQMYDDYKKPDTKIFNIDWDNLQLILRQAKLYNIYEYYFSLSETYPEYPEF